MKKKFTSYWAGYLFSPTQTLDKCPDYIDTVIIAFIGPDINSKVEIKFLTKIFPEKQIMIWINKLKSRGKKILISLLDTPNKHWDTVDFNIFGKSLKKLMIKWNIDGVDIDAESGENRRKFSESFVNLIKCCRSTIGKNKILSYTCYLGKIGHDDEIFSKTKNYIDYIQIMAYYYNFTEMKNLYNYYKTFFGNNICIGVKPGMNNEEYTPINEVIKLSKWNPKKLGMMLWTFNRDNFSFTHKEEWLWSKTIYDNMNYKNNYCLIS